ncbi:MAG: hypothetical protein JW870_09880 [Candidatus Delongbacteria bacterium]|nr:hypothetical protein [Candidatus Delongbacteria bacterium]MBN2819898.1 hypothetical protein [Bacteroidales bacterium]
MENKIDSNFIKSSNLLFITGGVIIIFYLVSLAFFKNEANPLPLVLINLGILGGVGLLIRQGFKWGKYTVLLLLIVYFTEALLITFKTDLNMNLTELIFFVMQLILISWSTLILFVKNHKANEVL